MNILNNFSVLFTNTILAVFTLGTASNVALCE